MKSGNVFQEIINCKGQKSFAVLIDPDKVELKDLETQVTNIVKSGAHFIFVGGSLITEKNYEEKLQFIHSFSTIPVLLFPGNPLQISKHVDAILFLSLLSGRNAELLIGNHVMAAPRIKELEKETISTGYLLIDCGSQTTASYMSNSNPIPYTKPEIAAATALAGEMLGMQMTYLDGGSGANKAVSESMIRAVRKQTNTPLIVGGGIKDRNDAVTAWEAGADIIIVGTAIENDPNFMYELGNAAQLIHN